MTSIGWSKIVSQYSHLQLHLQARSLRAASSDPSNKEKMTTEKSSRFQLFAQNPRVAAFRSWSAQKWATAKAIVTSDTFMHVNFVVAVFSLLELVIVLNIRFARHAIGHSNETLELIRQGTVTEDY